MIYFKGFGKPSKWQIRKCIEKHKDIFDGSFKTECDDCTAKLQCIKLRGKIK